MGVQIKATEEQLPPPRPQLLHTDVSQVLQPRNTHLDTLVSDHAFVELLRPGICNAHDARRRRPTQLSCCRSPSPSHLSRSPSPSPSGQSLGSVSVGPPLCLHRRLTRVSGSPSLPSRFSVVCDCFSRWFGLNGPRSHRPTRTPRKPGRRQALQSRKKQHSRTTNAGRQAETRCVVLYVVSSRVELMS